MYQEKEENI